MNEILPGVWHWTAEHPDIHQTVSSYYLQDAAALLDPLLPEGGLDAFAGRDIERVILTNRLHGRDTAEIVAARGVEVLAPEAGLHQFEDRDYDVTPFAPGDAVAPNVQAHALAAISPDDGVLHLAGPHGALHFADGLLLRDGELALMPDDLMDDPDAVKQTTYERLQPLLDLEFDALLFAHSDPVTERGHDRLAEFVAALRP